MLRLRSLAVLAALACAISSAAAQQRCEGTLCDLYYGGSAPQQPATAQPAGPTPMTVPTMSGAGGYITNLFSRSGDGAGGAQAAPAGQGSAAQAPQAAAGQGEGFFHMGGGGVTGQNRGGECGGTICDLFHGHSTEADGGSSVSQSVNGVPQSHYGNETASAEPAAAPIAMAPAPAAGAGQTAAERRVAVRTATKPPSCAAKAGDPWSCYRR